MTKDTDLDATAAHVKALSKILDAHTAEYIVRAVKSHEDMKAACNISATCFRKLAGLDLLAMSKSILLDNVKLIEAALAKATG